mmetsp:Transcript_79750/g.225529  ORF Transcript_79750/g.225529 Transcript_79750/m.225529 type:complete len:206 (-) Transcript_79750:55-672(-)
MQRLRLRSSAWVRHRRNMFLWPCTRSCLALKFPRRTFTFSMVASRSMVFNSSSDRARSPPDAWTKMARQTRWSIGMWICRSMSQNSRKPMEPSPLLSKARKARMMDPYLFRRRALISDQKRRRCSVFLRFSGLLSKSLSSAPDRVSCIRCALSSRISNAFSRRASGDVGELGTAGDAFPEPPRLSLLLASLVPWLWAAVSDAIAQ